MKRGYATAMNITEHAATYAVATVVSCRYERRECQYIVVNNGEEWLTRWRAADTPVPLLVIVCYRHKAVTSGKIRDTTPFCHEMNNRCGNTSVVAAS